MKNDLTKYAERDTCQRVFPLFEQYRAELVQFVNRRLHDTAQSEAVVSDVLVKLYRNCESLDSVNNMRAWLYQVTKRTVYDYFREQSKLTDFSPEVAEGVSEELEAELDISSFIPELINCLPQKYAVPLKMSDLDGIPQREIAQRLNLSLSGTKSRIQRGRQKLKQLLEECLHLETDRRGVPVDYQVKDSCNFSASYCDDNQPCSK
ncbi:sigma-70 family RNA polymerase sigma factor [Tunicatimonas pelagia]|uniref:sigma-70 family RNA polymerase sigma factor n=1 Tax=Tunicatimonas pelagia TaxID=931531 RepID=UPI0026656AF8|nr:sigma-70 family RNA polymerase sigma factor [Tunicatimonas pelagia]WKN43325.1 sigma-70 family RNA polymerase sigma factor [Tunicatimonas pelagia]